MHGHTALHVGWIKRQVVDLQHQLGQGEEPDLLGGRALGEQELYDARGSDFMVRSNIERWQGFAFFRAAQELEQACHDLHRYEKSQTFKFFGRYKLITKPGGDWSHSVRTPEADCESPWRASGTCICGLMAPSRQETQTPLMDRQVSVLKRW